jgi:sphinganine-1-phosphate aldolase
LPTAPILSFCLNKTRIIPHTAHAAFNKAGKYFKIRVIQVPVDPVTFKVNPRTVRSHITSNTIMIVASAPNFPNGAIDPIEELAQLALRYENPQPE